MFEPNPVLVMVVSFLIGVVLADRWWHQEVYDEE
jgi:hypothetical protein